MADNRTHLRPKISENSPGAYKGTTNA
jgi:hypothetical protein